MILVTTTPSVDGYTITNYQGIVFGEVVSGVNMFKDLGAGLRNMFGGRSQGYEEELMRARCVLASWRPLCERCFSAV